MQNSSKMRVLRYLLLHLALAAAGASLLLRAYLTRRLGSSGLYCPMHQLLHLYCPLCGGTRALISLLRLELGVALTANPIVLFTVPILLFFDARALARLLRGDGEPFRLPRSLLPALLILLIGYGLIRNLLLVIWKIDPLGDLLPYYS